jgi:hypothetical protein
MKGDLETFVVVFVRANPFPQKDITAEFAHSAVVTAYSQRPVGFSDGFEMQRWVKRIG